MRTCLAFLSTNRRLRWLELAKSQGRGAGARGLTGHHKDFGFHSEGNENPAEGSEQRKDDIQLTS